MPSSVKKDFEFQFTCKDLTSKLTLPVVIPQKQTVNDLVGRLVAAHNIPCYVIEEAKLKNVVLNSDLTSKLEKFIIEETDKLHDENAKTAVDKVINGEKNIDDLVEQWTKAYTQEVKKYAKPEEITEEQKFSEVYHKLIHSPALDTLLNLEHTYCLTMEDLIQQRDKDLEHLESSNRVRALSNTLPEAEDDERHSRTTRLEESFTIHLGAQMKTTHNLRLLCTDVLDLCRHKPHTVGGMVIPQPQRLQTAMSLYSNNLCGLILLVDNRLSSYTGLKREFARVCEQSSDFHFPDLEQQFAKVEEEHVFANEFRSQKKLLEESDKISIKSSSSSSSENQQNKGNCLQTGDFYITKHSNLSEVHTVFHLVVDENMKSMDITSRHPVILSIRNIIKLCFRYDINTITIPLLLTHEMTEEMTIQWCQKRAELLFKCVKGFIMEMATYGAQESRTIQFLVPREISEEMFANISAMLPSIFRLSNPVIGRSN
ncbi:hypothetical protein KUTeg_004391 [Tegillarca granosa]|uniref:Uncharacterized protein n=1 Tax=Tegillarca granosa TaxID=220873 RepID=A0ABQ9FSQ1_TEGGR|nr:hypothetical protein KUTeg_004391 [Tegillarca granosa]